MKLWSLGELEKNNGVENLNPTILSTEAKQK